MSEHNPRLGKCPVCGEQDGHKEACPEVGGDGFRSAAKRIYGICDEDGMALTLEHFDQYHRKDRAWTAIAANRIRGDE
jgi:hypothetical protein